MLPATISVLQRTIKQFKNRDSGLRNLFLQYKIVKPFFLLFVYLFVSIIKNANLINLLDDI